MPDITLAALITRTSLGLGDLDINDHLNYACGVPLLGGEKRYRRNQATSAYQRGAVEISATLDDVIETVTVEVMGTSQSNLMANVTTLRDAFAQGSYQLKLTINGVQHTWACKRADEQYEISTGRLAARQLKWVFSVPRLPDAVAGAF